MNWLNYENAIFDFDGTIATLHVDWPELKVKVNELCERQGVSTEQGFQRKVDALKSKGSDVLSLLSEYECPNGSPEYAANAPVVDLIKDTLPDYFIVSNNLKETIVEVLRELGILSKCQFIISTDMVSASKPDIEGFHALKAKLRDGKSIYIGDRETDRVFAESAGFAFCFESEVV